MLELKEWPVASRSWGRASGNFKGIKVAKGNADPTNQDKNDYEVDAIAGATITGDGVTAMLKSDLKLYVPYFKTLKTN